MSRPAICSASAQQPMKAWIISSLDSSSPQISPQRVHHTIDMKPPLAPQTQEKQMAHQRQLNESVDRHQIRAINKSVAFSPRVPVLCKDINMADVPTIAIASPTFLSAVLFEPYHDDHGTPRGPLRRCRASIVASSAHRPPPSWLSSGAAYSSHCGQSAPGGYTVLLLVPSASRKNARGVDGGVRGRIVRKSF